MSAHEADPRIDALRPELFSEVVWLSSAANRERRDGAGHTVAVTLEGDTATLRTIPWATRRESERRTIRFDLLDGETLAIVDDTPPLTPYAAVEPSLQVAAAERLQAIQTASERRTSARLRALPEPSAGLPWFAWVVGVCVVVIGAGLQAVATLLR